MAKNKSSIQNSMNIDNEDLEEIMQHRVSTQKSYNSQKQDKIVQYDIQIGSDMNYDVKDIR